MALAPPSSAANGAGYGPGLSLLPSSAPALPLLPWSTSEIPNVDYIQAQLVLQQRRALDAERLAAASGAISASLDVSVALDKVAEQLAHILRLKCAAVCIFDETDKSEGDVYIWSEQQPLRAETFSTMQALLGQVEVVSLIRERREPVLIEELMIMDAGLVFLCDEVRDSLTLVAQYGQPEIILSDLCAAPLKPLYEVAKRVTMSGEACLINDLKSDGRIIHQLHRALDFCDVMIVPLAAASTTLGVLLVGSHSTRGHTQDDLALFKTIGHQLGAALKNAQLLRAESEMGMLREADRLKSAFLASVSHDLQSPLTAIRASVEILLDQGIVQSVRVEENLLPNSFNH